MAVWDWRLRLRESEEREKEENVFKRDLTIEEGGRKFLSEEKSDRV